MSLFSYAKSAIKYGYSWISPTSWMRYFNGPDCAQGDFLCELTDEKMNLPSFVSYPIGKIEEVTGVSKYIAGPAIVGLTCLLGYQVYKKKYGATDPIDLIHKIIDKEFGTGSVADLLFKAFERAIEDAIDAILNRTKDNLAKEGKTLSVTEQAAKRKEIRAELIKVVGPQIQESLGQHKAVVLKIASALPVATKGVVSPLSEQQATKASYISRFVSAIVNPIAEQQARAIVEKQDAKAITLKAK